MRISDVDDLSHLSPAPVRWDVYRSEDRTWMMVAPEKAFSVHFGRPVLIKARPHGLASPEFNDEHCLELHAMLTTMHGTSAHRTTLKRAGSPLASAMPKEPRLTPSSSALPSASTLEAARADEVQASVPGPPTQAACSPIPIEDDEVEIKRERTQAVSSW
jgi:hypothetical protein